MDLSDNVYHTADHNKFDAAITRSTQMVLNPLELEVAARDESINVLFREMHALFADSPVDMKHIQSFKIHLQSSRRREEKLGKEHPALTCPIGGRLIKDPVVAADGHLYERRNIQSWFDNCALSSATSPVTGKHVLNTDLTENKKMKRGILRMLLETI
jgi:hypothetical protein